MKRTLKVASDGFMFWPLKCVGVEDLMGSDIPTSEKVSHEFGQYSGRDVFFK